MLFTFVLILYFSVISILLLYSVSYFFSFFLFLFSREKKLPKLDREDRGEVAVLIPSLQEGESLVDTVKTILFQDYLGTITVYVLIKDSFDNSHTFLEKYLEQNKIAKNRKVIICLTGEEKKKEKINLVLPKLSDPYIAFLDADHRADSQWVSSSLTVMINEGFDAVQAVRKPLAISSFFQVWDSIQNHIGNEVFNTIYRKLKLTTFFTGTTCIFKGSLLKGRPFPESLTEDTLLSYELILSGKKIGYNPFYGSYEEVAPDVTSYISRRRRWSNGHNQTFFSNIKRIFQTKIGVGQKLQLWLHGGYYLLPVLIVLATNIVGWYFYFQYTSNIQILCLGLSVFIALSIGLLRYNNIRNLIYEFVVAFVSFFPYVAFFSVFLYKFFQYEFFYHIIDFPFRDLMFWVTLVLVTSPLLTLIAGRRLYKYPSIGIFLSCLLLYPFILLVDIFGCSLGFCDFIFKRKGWGRVNRYSYVDSSIVPKNVSDNTDIRKLKVRQFYAVTLLPAFVILVIMANDFLVFHNCGVPQYFFSDYIIYKIAPPIDSKLSFRISSFSRNQYRLSVINDVVNAQNLKGVLTIKVNKKSLYQGPIESKLVTDFGMMGWKTGTISAEINTEKFTCVQNKKFSTSVKEMIDGKLHLNGEPFLIKCIIPSFSNSKVNLDVDTGLKQIKRAGANCIRLYHTPQEDFLVGAKKYQLLIVSQPDETTWENISMSDDASVKRLFDKYKKHVALTEGYPYILLDSLGNELEFNSIVETSVPNIKKVLNEVKGSHHYRLPISYSTYFTFIKYPLDILGINMLDSGDVYWSDALTYARSLNIPFYASEFGGFVAFYERTPSFLRIHRLYENWQDLMRNQALGAAFFQSHDNWAQPVPTGYNDPFTDEMPDDTRGFWDIDNRPKEELNHLSHILSDLRFEYLGSRQLKVINQRSFRIQNLKLSINQQAFEKDELGEGDNFLIHLNQDIGLLKIKADYLTHLGLKNEIEFNLDLKKGMRPITLLSQVIEVKQSHDNLNWVDFKTENTESKKISLKISIPRDAPESSYIMLSGLGTDVIKLGNLINGKDFILPVHSYREEILPLKLVREKLGNVNNFIIEISSRDSTTYLDESDGKNIFVSIKKPYLIHKAN